MNEDNDVIRMVEENAARVQLEQALRAERKAQKEAERQRKTKAVFRMLLSCLPADLVILGSYLAVEQGLMATKLSTRLVVLALLYIGFGLGRLSKEVR